jgi:Putative zinc-finger
MTTEVCRRWRDLFGAYLLGRLTPEERVGLEAHLDGCADCRAELAELRPVAAALAAADPAHLGTPPAPPPELGDRVLAQVRDENRLARRRRWALRAGAGVAAAVIALTVVVVATRPEAPSRAEKEDFAFSALPAGVDAQATLYTYRTDPRVEVWLEYEGLTPGTTYAVWVERATGERVRCGTFDAIEGRHHTVLASQVPRSDAAAVGFTSTDGRQVYRAPVTKHA